MISLQPITNTTKGYVYQGNTVLCADNKQIAELLLQPLSALFTKDYCCVETASSLTGKTLTGIQATAGVAAPTGYHFEPLRQFVYDNKTDTAYCQDMLRMKALSSWILDNQFCGTCGTCLTAVQTETALVCPKCKRVIYPRISPAVIVLVHNGNKILLARHAQRNQTMYTCLAGFVESGESLEQAVIREVKEETGITVTNVRYAGSQSWPYPDQLMLAFHADYLCGEISVQKEEIQEAYWFSENDNPATPPCGSVAWNLIHGDMKA